MRQIPLTQGKIAIVDDEDFARLNQWKWCAWKHRNNYYAVRVISNNDKQSMIRMHRLAINAPTNSIVDHINHNTLDNRKCNLRLCSNQQNQFNQISRKKGKTSKYKGVRFRKDTGKWSAQITKNRRQIALGSYGSEVIAAKAYDKKAKELFGEFAKTNYRKAI